MARDGASLNLFELRAVCEPQNKLELEIFFKSSQLGSDQNEPLAGFALFNLSESNKTHSSGHLHSFL